MTTAHRNSEVLEAEAHVHYSYVINREPMRVEEGHGYHSFDDSYVAHEQIEGIQIEVAGVFVELTKQQVKQIQEAVKSQLEFPNN